jgi:RND family efflux transporter MFP subunit
VVIGVPKRKLKDRLLMVNDKKKSPGPVKAADEAGKRPSRLLRFLIPLGIIGAGVLVMVILVKSKKLPQRVEKNTPAPLVEVQKLNVRDIQMVVRGFGTVSPKVQVEIVPQVAGKVVYFNPQFKVGGFVRAGEKLLQIDPRDYELALQQARAIVADATVKLDLEKAEAQVARKEWEQLNPDTEPTSPLVLREPQIRQAQALLESARAQLATAELSLERTRLSLPIDAVIVSEKVDLGQFVSVGQSIGVAYGVESVEIEVPLRDEELAWFDIPGNPVSFNGGRSADGNTVARVETDFAGARHTWTGYVMRTTGQIDKTSRFVSVVVEVPKPFEKSDSRPPLVPGMFVEVLIEGRVLKNAVPVPRDAVHSGNEVWVVRDDRLHVVPLSIVRTDKDFAYAASGLDDGAQIVVSALDIVTDGMEVRAQVAADSEPNPAGQRLSQPDLGGTD